MSSGPHQMNIGWREVRTSRTVTRRLCGHVSGEPSEDFDQSNPLVSAPISPPPARKSPTTSPTIHAPYPDAKNQVADRLGRSHSPHRVVARRHYRSTTT